MPKHDPMIRLKHMRDYAQKAIQMASSYAREDLDRHEMLSLALTRLVELVGESANYVPEEVRQHYDQIPWPQVIGMRHRLIHGYDQVDYDILWTTIQRNLPELLSALEQIVGKE